MKHVPGILVVRMTRLFTMILLIAFSSVALSTTLYRWVDEEGRVHFSDQPRQGAEEVTVRSPSTFETPKPPVRRKQEAPRQEEKFRYESLNIVQPTAEQTLWNIEGVLNVSVTLTPALRPGHKLRAHINGNTTDVGTGRSFKLNEVYRGEQNLSVSVVDAMGRELTRSPTVKFFVQQTSIN